MTALRFHKWILRLRQWRNALNLAGAQLRWWPMFRALFTGRVDARTYARRLRICARCPVYDKERKLCRKEVPWTDYEHCPRCGAKMIGDGYHDVMHCENADPDSYAYHEPDAQPVFCEEPPKIVGCGCYVPYKAKARAPYRPVFDPNNLDHQMHAYYQERRREYFGLPAKPLPGGCWGRATMGGTFGWGEGS